MIGRLASFGVAALLAAPALAQDAAWPTGEITAPSGLSLFVEDVLYEEQPYSGEMQVVVRLVAPGLRQEGGSGSQLREDMDWACRTWGLPAAGRLSSAPDWVVVELMEAPVARGTTAPDIRRIFETYRVEGPVCIWELF